MYWVAALVAVLALAGAAVTLTARLTSAGSDSPAAQTCDQDALDRHSQVIEGDDAVEAANEGPDTGSGDAVEAANEGPDTGNGDAVEAANEGPDTGNDDAECY